ncbi:MAG: hypothetical protein WCJ64_26480, partial [Rhodospirillaceae bacterium]
GKWAVALAALIGTSSGPVAADTAVCPPSLEIECSLSAFATLAYAVSDNKTRYLHSIDSSGSMRADSLAGSQLDVHFNPKWGMTFQGVIKPPLDKDTGWEPVLSWAFLSYRPSNEWLIRVGKLRPPLFIYSQNMEVGITYDQVRPPPEFYSISSMYDLIGGSVGKTWALDDGSEVTLEGYVGGREQPGRHYDSGAGSASYGKNDVRSAGLVLSRSTEGLLLRAGFHAGRIWRLDGNGLYYQTYQPVALPFPSPLGGTLYRPDGPLTKADFYIYTVGVDWSFDDWQLTSEFALKSLPEIKIVGPSYGGYVTLARKIKDWTPYITLAGIRTGDDQLELFQNLNNTPVPLLVRGAPTNLPASYHQTLAGEVQVYDQWSLTLGSAYRLSSTTKLKAEWMHTEVGVGSVLFDGLKANSRVNIFTVSISKTF